MEKEVLKRIIEEVMQEREEKKEYESKYSFYRFSIIFFPITLCLGVMLFVLSLNSIDILSGPPLLLMLNRHLCYVASIMLILLSLLGIALSLWFKPNK